MSLEGTLAGIGASLLFAGVALAMGQVDGVGALVATFAAFVATTLESWQGSFVRSRRAQTRLNFALTPSRFLSLHQ